VVVGVDGSDEARAAAAVVGELRRRFAPTVRVLAASRGKEVDLEAARDTLPGVEIVDERPVDALLDASRSADLLVLGHRGLGGLKALGSVSERVAHRAGCSVLVVR
jgi:nucleotide-binding universal stress UspA family protein